MSHIFVKPSLVIETAVKVLRRQIVLPNYVLANALGDFGGSANDTINVRVGAVMDSRTRKFRGTGAERKVVMDDLTETSFPVTLDDVIYNAVTLTDEQLTLDIKDFIEQVIVPQVGGVAYGIENYLYKLISSAPYQDTHWINPEDTFPAFVDARRALNDENVEYNDRVMIVGSAVESALLKDPQFRRYDATGSEQADALRQAHIGNVAGLPVLRSNALKPDEAFEWQRNAFIYINRAPKKPFSTAINAYGSYAASNAAFRWLADYDFDNLADRSLLDTYVGSRVVLERDGRFVRGVRLQLAATGISIPNQGLTVTAAAGPNNTAKVKVLDSNGVDVTAKSTFKSGTEAKATVADDGTVTGVATGTSVITATYNPPQGGAAVTATVTANVV